MPFLNEERHIVASVQAMQRQDFAGTLEFLLVDGGSTDRSREILARMAAEDGRIRVLDNPRRITSAGLNVALAHARGRWVARMDAHTEYPPGYIRLGIERLQAGGTSWVSGPPIAQGTGPISRAVSLALLSPLGRGASRKWAGERLEDAPEYELDAGVFAGVWERSTLMAYGGWDEAWVRNQDSEMAGRFLARGERLICLPAMASHYAPRDSLASLWRQYLQYGEFREKTARRHPQTMRRSHLLAPGAVACTGAAAIAPRPVRSLARLGLAIYALVTMGAGAAASRSAARSDEAALVPLVLAVMHAGHGAGWFVGALRHGPPLAALARGLGLNSLAERLVPPPRPVYAPSLEMGSAVGKQRPG